MQHIHLLAASQNAIEEVENMASHQKLNRARISDLFVLTAVVAAFASTPTFRSAIPGFVALSLTFFAVWNRPLVFRFWACGMIGFGTGMFLAGVYELQGFYLQRAEIIGWGGGIVLGTTTAILLFIGPLALKDEDQER